MNITEMEHALRTIAAREAEKWFKAQCHDLNRMIYLYYRPALPDQEIGDVKVSVKNPGEGFELAMPQRLSPAFNRTQVSRLIYEALRKVPILGTQITA